jgi:hypothetical protein
MVEINLQKTVRNEISAGVLMGGLFVACLLWFLAYTTDKATAYYEFAPANAYLSK